MSLLCANFILSMGNLEPSYVLTHYYCGFHCSLDDTWYGPNGLVRSVITQLLVELKDQDRLDLDFLGRQSYVQELENHNLDILCDTMHELVTQFDPDTMVFLVIDGVSHFDLDLGGLFGDLQYVIDRLQGIVEDDELCPKFKVVMTVLAKSSLRLGRLVDPAYRLQLPFSGLNPRMLSEQSVGAAISRPVTTSIDSSKSISTSSCIKVDNVDYDD